MEGFIESWRARIRREEQVEQLEVERCGKKQHAARSVELGELIGAGEDSV